MNDVLTILQGDSVEQLRSVPDESVQCCVTSPPYDNLRTYGGLSWNFEETAKELYRVMELGGTVCWNMKDSVTNGSESLTSAKQRIFFKEVCGFNIYDTLIWEKPAFSNPDPTRYHDVFEYVFVLSKGRIKTFNPIQDRKNLYAGKVTFGISTYQSNGDGEKRARRTQNVVINEFGKRNNIWRGGTVAHEEPCAPLEHPAMMPEWLAHDLILSWSNYGDTVLYPFAGSGTTGRAAIDLGRRALLIEKNSEYIPLIKERCSVTVGMSL
jgi:DNA modification methylase